MTESVESPSRTNFLRILPGIIISLGALVVIFILVDWHQVMEALRDARYLFLFLGFPIYLVGYGFRAMAWRTLLMEEVSFKQVFLTMQVGYFLNNVLPFRLGELGRALLLGRKGLGFWRVFSTILIERAFDMILAAGLLLGTIPFVLGGPQSRMVANYVIFMVLFGMIILHLLAKYQDWVIAKFDGLRDRWSVLSHFGEERLKAFFEGLSALVHFPRFLRVLGWMALSWGAAILYCPLRPTARAGQSLGGLADRFSRIDFHLFCPSTGISIFSILHVRSSRVSVVLQKGFSMHVPSTR